MSPVRPCWPRSGLRMAILTQLLHSSLSIADSCATGQTNSSAACSVCDSFAGGDGFFSVAIDCFSTWRNQTYKEHGIPVGNFLLRNENWMKNVLPGCLTTLISSLGTTRPASFFRHGLPTETYMDTPSVLIGRRTGAVVTGSYALDAGFWPAAAAGQLREKPDCESESTHAQDRFRAYSESCSLAGANMTCRFDRVDAMAEQYEAYLKLYNAARAAGSQCIDKSTMHNQVSLRYGVDDVVGVGYMRSEHAPLASKFLLWLRELTGRDLPLISMVKKGHCECTALDLAGHPVELALLTPRDMSGEESSACAQRCGEKGQPACCTGRCTVPKTDTIVLDPRRHAIFMRIPSSGAAAIECATADLEREGLWTNLGGQVTSFEKVKSCMASCRIPWPGYVVPILILTVRNPYDYWRSTYLRCSASSKPLTTSNGQKANASFSAFLQSIAGAPATFQSTISQSGHIRRICGDSCDYWFLLHSETLNADYLSLLAHLNLPLVQGLPRRPLNSSDLCANRARVYTPGLASIVQEMEALLFEPRFGYSRHIGR